MQILKLGHGHHVPDSSWDGKEIWFDLWGSTSAGLDQGFAYIDLPAANTLPSGWKCRIRKSDPMSYSIQIKPSVPGDKLNHFWDTNHPYGLFVNMTQQIVDLSCDGVADYALAGLAQHRNVPQSHRTVTIPEWSLTPVSANEIVRCDVSQSPTGTIAIVIDQVIPNWCPPSSIVGGNYLSSVFWVQKCDAGPGRVTIWMADGSRIYPSNDVTQTGSDRGYWHLCQRWETVMFYVAPDGVRAISYSRPGFVGAQ